MGRPARMPLRRAKGALPDLQRRQLDADKDGWRH
jgi:hypothetical protein